MLTETQIERYSRQIIIPEVGARGQERLLASEVAIHAGRSSDAAVICAGYLALAGIGRLWLAESFRAEAKSWIRARTADVDVVDETSGSTDLSIGFDLVVESDSRRPRLGWLVASECGPAARVTSLPSPLCVECARRATPRLAPSGPFAGASSPLVASLAAGEALSRLLGIGSSKHRETIEIELDTARISRSPLDSCAHSR